MGGRRFVMKRKKALTMVLAVICVISCLMVPTLASNTDDTRITPLTVAGSGYKVYPGSRDKQDDSPLYLWITSLTSSYVRVKALGTDSASATSVNTTNCTCSTTSSPYLYVTCYWDVDYSVHSTVYEDHFTYATYGFVNPFNDSLTLAAWWSPDSWNTHVDATP